MLFVLTEVLPGGGNGGDGMGVQIPTINQKFAKILQLVAKN